MEILDEMDQTHKKEMQLYNSVFTLLSFEKIGYTEAVSIHAGDISPSPKQKRCPFMQETSLHLLLSRSGVHSCRLSGRDKERGKPPLLLPHQPYALIGWPIGLWMHLTLCFLVGGKATRDH
ncbi:hypothetical protein FKM82_026204 [Ascaphus truei]